MILKVSSSLNNSMTLWLHTPYSHGFVPAVTLQNFYSGIAWHFKKRSDSMFCHKHIEISNYTLQDRKGMEGEVFVLYHVNFLCAITELWQAQSPACGTRKGRRYGNPSHLSNNLNSQHHISAVWCRSLFWHLVGSICIFPKILWYEQAGKNNNVILLFALH